MTTIITVITTMAITGTIMVITMDIIMVTIIIIMLQMVSTPPYTRSRSVNLHVIPVLYHLHARTNFHVTQQLSHLGGRETSQLCAYLRLSNSVHVIVRMPRRRLKMEDINACDYQVLGKLSALCIVTKALTTVV